MPKHIEITENKQEIELIAQKTCEILSAEHGISITEQAAAGTVAYVFLKQAIKFVSENRQENTEVVINLFQLLDVGVSHEEVDGEKDGNYVPFVAPGQEFKLLVKSDDGTED